MNCIGCLFCCDSVMKNIGCKEWMINLNSRIVLCIVWVVVVINGINSYWMGWGFVLNDNRVWILIILVC